MDWKTIHDDVVPFVQTNLWVSLVLLAAGWVPAWYLQRHIKQGQVDALKEQVKTLETRLRVLADEWTNYKEVAAERVQLAEDKRQALQSSYDELQAQQLKGAPPSVIAGTTASVLMDLREAIAANSAATAAITSPPFHEMAFTKPSGLSMRTELAEFKRS